MITTDIIKEEPAWKDKHFEILCRIDDACRRSGIKMFLCDEAALVAYREGELADYVNVAIDVRDAQKFREVMSEEEGLEIRGMFNYYRYPYFDIKVYDPNTIDFNLATERQYGFDSLYVTVKFIHHLPNMKRVARWTRRTKKEYKKFIRSLYNIEGVKRGKRAKAYRTVAKLTEEKNIGKAFFDFLVKRYSGNTKKLGLDKDKFDKAFFDKGQNVTIRNRQFQIPLDEKTYFETRFGKRWKEIEVTSFEETNSHFRDVEHSPSEFRELIDYLDFDTFYKNNKKIKSYRPRFQTLDGKFNRTKYVLERTHLRFVFWQSLMPIKDRLIELHKEGNYEQLEEIMSDYLRQIDRFSARSMTIFFDREIFDIAKDVFIHKGRPEMAEYIEKKIPEEHLKPIVIKDYKGDNIQ